MRANQADYPIAMQCEVLEVSTSGYYAWLEREPSARSVADEALLEKIEVVHAASDRTYGAPRIHAALRHEGIKVGKKRVARLMAAAGLRGVSRRRGVRTTQRSEREPPAPDLVGRDFSAEGPDELWVADITYIPTWAGFLFLAVVMDTWSRKVVGWSMSTSLKSQIVLDALNMAVYQRQPVDVVHHSDQGCQYTSLAFGKRCDEAGVRPSMGSAGDCYDNAMCESFFATLETELILRRRFRSHAEAKMAIFRFIEAWYNPLRLHSGLNYLSPNDFEELHSTTAAAA